MTSFQDGPAKGQRLMLKRTPRFLRVTELLGMWDALDRLEDSPQPQETLHAYEFAAHHGNCHIRAARDGGFYAIVEYKYVTEQPDDATMRDDHLWTKWCEKMLALRTQQA